jgi:sec-independent protein translocase protein TatA
MSAGEILLILFIYLLLFGAKGLPSIAQTLGKAVYQFRNATKDVQEEIMKSANDIRKEAANNVRLDQLDMDEAPRTKNVPQQPTVTAPTSDVPASGSEADSSSEVKSM